MKILISPSKEKKKLSYNFKTTNPLFMNKADYLAKKIKTLNYEEIISAYKCNEKIANKVILDFKNFNKDTHPALFYFYGLQYKYIKVESLEKLEIKFLLDNLYITDALYGILRPSDLISDYRLDYKTKLPFFDYDYYKDDLDKVLNDKVINLCSSEFSKNINIEKLYTINFVQNVKGQVKSYSTHTKIARGNFVHYLAKHKSSEIDIIKKYNIDGYYIYEENERGIIFRKDFE